MRRLLQEAGQVPIVLQKEIDGFVVNRLQYGLLGEAFRLVQDGVVAVTDYNPKSISFFFFFCIYSLQLSHTLSRLMWTWQYRKDSACGGHSWGIFTTICTCGTSACAGMLSQLQSLPDD